MAGENVMFKIKRTYMVSNATTIKHRIESLHANQVEVDIDTYRYTIEQKKGEQYIFIPRSTNVWAYNSFLPQVTVFLTENTVTIQYELLRSIKRFVLCFFAFLLLLEGVLLIATVDKTKDIFSLCISPIICAFVILITTVGFTLSRKRVEKKILHLLDVK